MNDYKEWEPIKDIQTNLYFVGAQDELGSLIILLKEFKEFGSKERTLKFKFSGVLGYRIVQEAGRLKTLYENRSLAAFNVSYDSEFLRWFKEESSGIFDDWDLTHYAICNSDNIIDIISGPPVEVEWIYEGS